MVEPADSGKHRIALVCDFFYPNVGGVETHIYQLGSWLVALGHKVVVVTRQYGQPKQRRAGIRWLGSGIKVYYLPLPPWWRASTIPTLFCFYHPFRDVILRERIDIIHTHQAVSSMAHEAVFIGRTLGIPTVYTDHSLVGFTEFGSRMVNAMLECTLSDTSQVICVSHTCKENTVLRSHINPDIVSVIPNAIDSSQFTPGPVPPPAEWVTVVLMSRLVYRKGVDLAIDIIPSICERFPRVRFLIGGDGPKRIKLEEMREQHQLQDRVEVLGEVPHDKVRDVLIRGDVFLNPSLTEGFCIAILEAASCGLTVVSTKVGGIPEVLPRHMIHYAKPTADDLFRALAEAIPQAKKVDRAKRHAEASELYSWEDVARRTERVYDKAALYPKTSLLHRFTRMSQVGIFGGTFWGIMAVIQNVFAILFDFFSPRSSVEPAPEIPRANFAKYKQKRDGKTLN